MRRSANRSRSCDTLPRSCQITVADAPISMIESSPNPANATELVLTAATSRRTPPTAFQASVPYSSSTPVRTLALMPLF
jgi:hypothetical protein